MAKKEFEQEKLNKLIEQTNEWKIEFVATDLFKNLDADVQAQADSILTNFVNQMYQSELRVPREWTGATVEKTLTEVLPVTIPNFAAVATAVVPLLTAYFDFLQENKKISNGPTLVRKLEKITFATETVVETSQEKQTEVKKSVTPKNKAKKSTYTQSEIDSFNMFPMGNYQFNSAPAKPVADSNVNFANVGRNEPCPCGSGKKFKKCHGK